MSNIESAIVAASSDNPSEFKDSIQNALVDKLGIALDLKKVEVASQFMQPEEPIVEPVVEPDSESDLAASGELEPELSP